MCMCIYRFRLFVHSHLPSVTQMTYSADVHNLRFDGGWFGCQILGESVVVTCSASNRYLAYQHFAWMRARPNWVFVMHMA